MEQITDKFFKDMMHERKRQIEKWGFRVLDMPYYLTILVEEVGEVARAILDKDPKDIRDELIQVATVAKTMAENLDVEDIK